MHHTRRLTHMQHTKRYSHAPYYRAAHKLLLVCSVRKIASVQYMKVDSHAAHFVSLDSSYNKKFKNTCVFSAHKCQLRRELYYSYSGFFKPGVPGFLKLFLCRHLCVCVCVFTPKAINS